MECFVGKHHCYRYLPVRVPFFGDLSQVLELLPQYIEVVKQLAERFDARLVRLQDVFQRQLQYRDADTFCPEPVHPNQAGHLVIAQALIDALTT